MAVLVSADVCIRFLSLLELSLAAALGNGRMSVGLQSIRLLNTVWKNLYSGITEGAVLEEKHALIVEAMDVAYET